MATTGSDIGLALVEGVAFTEGVLEIDLKGKGSDEASFLGLAFGDVRALEIANSPNIGVCLCCGTWMEGGRGMGKDVVEATRAFAKMGKLWKIHFRNVSAPIPGFVETFVDNGYTDMKQVMRALVAVDFRGILIADHVPQMIGDRRTAWAYSIGYIKALYDMARDERRGP